MMVTLTVSAARAKLYNLLDKAASSHQPIQITGKRNNAILVSDVKILIKNIHHLRNWSETFRALIPGE